MTRELRRSGVFSLNVRPSTSTRAPWIERPCFDIAFTNWDAT